MNTISIRTGLFMLTTFVALFLLMYSMGMGYRSEIRIANVAIMLFFIYRAIKTYYLRNPEFIDNYLSGIKQGMGASVIGIGGYTIFMSIFLWLNPVLMDTIEDNSVMGPYLHPFTSSLFILTEGLVVSLIGSYILTRILIIQIKKEPV